MERTWYVVATAKMAVIFRGVFINPKQKVELYMTDGELNNLKDCFDIIEYRDNKEFPKMQETIKSQPIIEENTNSKGEENELQSISRTNKTKYKTKVSKSTK